MQRPAIYLLQSPSSVASKITSEAAAASASLDTCFDANDANNEAKRQCNDQGSEDSPTIQKIQGDFYVRDNFF